MLDLIRRLEPVNDARRVKVMLTLRHPHNQAIGVKMLHADHAVLLLEHFLIKILHEHAVFHF